MNGHDAFISKSKNITYHQTAAAQSRRTRNDAGTVAGLGLAGLSATAGKPGFGNQSVKNAVKATGRLSRLNHGNAKNMEQQARATKADVKNIGHTLRAAKRTVHPGRGLAEAALVGGAATAVGAEASNIYHRHQEQKLRRNRVSKAAKKPHDIKTPEVRKYIEEHKKEHGKPEGLVVSKSAHSAFLGE